MESILSKQLQSNEIINPFLILQKIINIQISDRDLAIICYAWMTLDPKVTANISKVVYLPMDISSLCCDPIINALVLWSKMKFHSLRNISWISQNAKNAITTYIHEVEQVLVKGIYDYFINHDPSTNNNMEFDHFCKFATLCQSRVSYSNNFIASNQKHV